MATTVFNLTDVSTPALVANKQVGITVTLGKAVIAPGGSGELDAQERVRLQATLTHYVGQGVLAVDRLPAPYQLAKAKMQATQKKP